MSPAPATPATTAMDRGAASAPELAGDPVIRYGWLLAAVWLVFLVFPIAAIWSGDGAPAAEAAAIGLLVVFAGVYIHGFRAQAAREAQALAHTAYSNTEYSNTVYSNTVYSNTAYSNTVYSNTVEPDDDRAGVVHFAVLVVLAVGAFALTGIPALGAASFVVSFAVFHFSWRVIWVTFAAALASVIVIPVAMGIYGDVWFLTLIVVTVGAATMLIRVVELHHVERAELQTRLAVSDERARVARDVHDVLGHSLTAVILKAELCQRLLEEVDPDDDRARTRVAHCRQQLDELHSVSRSALAEIRSTVGGLRSATLADELAAARTVLADAGVELLITGEVADIDERHRTMLSWVVREAVTNIVRHARATTCHIQFGPAATAAEAATVVAAPTAGQSPAGGDGQGGTVVLRIADDGVGTGGRAEGNGLRGLRERAEAAGVRLCVRSGPGTRVEVVV